MENKLNVGRLAKAELSYHLRIRGVTEDTTVGIMRSTLRGLLKLEKSTSFVAPPYPFTFADDKEAIEVGLPEIKNLISKFQGTLSSSEYAKITAKIGHYTARANNCNPSKEDEKNIRSKFLVQLVTLSSQIESKAKHPDRASATQNPSQSLGSREVSEEEDSADDDYKRVSSPKVSPATVKSIPVSKWNLTYSGNNHIISLNAFLERVEETCIARNTTHTELFTSALDLFTDRALIWYRANRKDFTCWNDLVQGLRDEFLPVNYDDQLMEEVKHRTQGQNESIGLYLSVMSNLFARFTHKISDANQLKILMKNILPFYQTQLGLVEITSIPQLLKLCRQLEARRVSVESFAPPPGRNKALEPDLAYIQVTSNLADVNINSTASAVDNRISNANTNNNRSDNTNRTRLNSQNCWNCGQLGHRSSQCRQTRTKHCFRCGHPNVTVVNCPKCSKKLPCRSLSDHTTSGDVNNQMVNPYKPLLDFILAHAQNDERPFLEVSIFDKSIFGLLDSGASNTIAGQLGCEILQQLGLPIRKINSSCTVANGVKCEVVGCVSAPIRLRDNVKIINILLVPTVTNALILGADFWKIHGIVPDLRRGEWTFSKDIPISTLEHLTSELDQSQHLALEKLLNESFPASKEGELGCTNLIEYEIKVTGSPIKQRYYPLSPAMQKVVNNELDEMLRLGVIQKSNSAWSSPILMVPKKDGSLRFCVDFRKINQVIEKDAYPLPYISNTLDKLRNAQYLSSLDIKSAYWQIPLHPDSQPYTAFTVPNRGLFEFCRLPFGLTTAPSVFQRIIDRVIGADLEPYVFTYLDDIIVISPTFEKHLEILKIVFDRINNAGFTLNRNKCQFCRPEIKYLGYVVNKCGLHVDPDKVQAILKYERPKSTSDIRRFIGMASWYRRHIENFSIITAPLTNLLRKHARFVWTDECESAFQTLKNHLVAAPVLSCPDFSKTFTIQCDASDYGIGAALTQEFDDGEKVICYLSQSLSRQQRKFSTTEKECLAVLWAIEKLRPYVEGSHFKVITDHYSLLWLRKLQNPSGRLARWSVRLQQYDFEIIHRKGKEHLVPDALSRAVPVVETVAIIPETPSTDKWYNKLLESIQRHPIRYPKFRIEDQLLYKAVDTKNEYGFPEQQGKWKIVVPKDKRIEILHQHHDIPTSGHLGVYKTFHRLATKYYWPKMKSDVASYIRKCQACIKSKPEQRTKAGEMGGHSQISAPWEVISIDLVGPLPRSSKGYNHILVVVDLFSKFSLCFPLRKATASKVVEHLENDVFLLFGVPRKIVSDNGVQFRSKEYRRLLNQYQISSAFVSFYHPQSNPTERVNRVIKTMLIAYVSENHREWDKYLPKVACALRSAQHETTGHSPYYVNFGKEMRLLGSEYRITPDQDESNALDHLPQRSTCFNKLYMDVRARLQRAYEKSKHRYDLRHRPVSFYPNQVVWRKNFVLSDASKFYAAKLADKFIGPFLIHRKVSPTTYELKDQNGKVQPGTWNVEHLKPHPHDD